MYWLTHPHLGCMEYNARVHLSIQPRWGWVNWLVALKPLPASHG